MVPLDTAEEERLVFTVIELRNYHGPADRSSHFMVGEGIADIQRVLASLQLVKILPVHQGPVQIPILQAAMKFVGSALEHTTQLPARGVPELCRHPRRVHLELLNHVERRGNHRLVAVRVPQHRLLRIHAVQRESQRPLPLPDGMLSVDDVHPGHVKIDAVKRFL